MDNHEEVYTEGVEREEEIFLEGLQNKKSLTQLEKEYSQKVREIRRVYEKSIKKELKKEKWMLPIKNIKKEDKEQKEFHVENLNLERDWKDKKQIEISTFSYRNTRKIKNFLNKITPNCMIYSYYKIMISLINLNKEIKMVLKNIFNKISENILIILTYIKEGFMKIISELKKITQIFKKKPSKPEKEIEKKQEKKEDGKEDN